jgi:DNA-binding response OmpR family regulator
MAKILIVEDDADLMETFTDLLTAHGHSICCASRIGEASSLLVEIQPEIITLDLNLPGNSGTVISTFIRTIKASSQCKIIVITGHAEMITAQSWLNEVDLVMTKPVNHHQLITMIDRLLTV